MSTVGRKLLSAIVNNGTVNTLVNMHLQPVMFRDSEIDLYNLIFNHVEKYGVLPKIETISKTLPGSLVDADEPPEYYLSEVQTRYKHTVVKKVVEEAIPYLEQKNPDKAIDALVKGLDAVFLTSQSKHLFDLRDLKAKVIGEYLHVKTNVLDTSLKFGWPTLDSTTAGIMPGDFVTFMGRPAAGKTFKILRLAQHAFNTGHRPLLVSMEMGTMIIAQRLAAMKAHIPLTKLLKAELSSGHFKKLEAELEEYKVAEAPFWMVDGNLATTGKDIQALCRKLKPTVLLVDGAYLVRSNDPRSDRFSRITDNAEFLKQVIATDMGIPVVASYQLNRSSTKKQKGEKKGVEDIYGSDAIGQLSTVALGLYQEESVETLKQREIQILKGRNGEIGRFNIYWDFDKMNFDEVVKEDEEKDLGFLG